MNPANYIGFQQINNQRKDSQLQFSFFFSHGITYTSGRRVRCSHRNILLFIIAMRSLLFSLCLLASSILALPETAPPVIAACAEVHILVARASGQGKGEGLIGSLSRAIKTALKGADSEAVDYPAALALYGSSEIKGVKAA